MVPLEVAIYALFLVSSSFAFSTPALKTLSPSGVSRFAVRYATAKRWGRSTLATTGEPFQGWTNVSTFPPACPQPGLDPALYSEDCLTMILYIPPFPVTTRNASTLMWIHGGSFVVGSASGPGLDGSQLAIATSSIVAVIQYRLGALGFLAPDGATNLAVGDVINAMKFLREVVPAFGGSPSKITIAGQSSGANMVRALLATPSASSHFHHAILQSDPMNFGFLNPATQQALRSNFNGLIKCRASDRACANKLSLDSILSAQDTLFRNAITIAPAAGSAQPIRPVRDGMLITFPLDSTAKFPSVTKSILVSTVQNEAGYTIYSAFPDYLAQDAFRPVLNASLGPARTAAIVAAPFYSPIAADKDDARAQLQLVGTDQIWKCPGWTFIRNWVYNGGRAYVGNYVVGATYPGNNVIPFCTQPSVVCHQDDIMIVFGTVSNATAAQSALITEMQTRYREFLAHGNPNANGLTTWAAATSSSNVNSKELGGSGTTPVNACRRSFWGQTVPYDYQVYGI